MHGVDLAVYVCMLSVGGVEAAVAYVIGVGAVVKLCRCKVCVV